jgi:hypothetical protein
MVYLPTVEWEDASTRTVQYSQTLRPPIGCATRRVYDQYCRDLDLLHRYTVSSTSIDERKD